ncbi:hypothetical protein NQ997_18635 [Acinetobacter baumannii]|nr:hypothetical protein [Acinetobacter baumannii]MDC4898153.1 hypothetical protein [Acinetobacter baumannii]MDC4901831.1 hypothetical protein [Acinetobacter baumannii]MDC4915744.1 hypothetical protein [Acinetobacter baumannii]
MENKNYHWLILLAILFTVVAAWLSFPIFFEWLITKHFHINPEDYGKKFGAVGDTYGSLNTLISSIALCAVAYSTWLQVTSLKETREVNKLQIDLAEKNHLEQLNESRNAIFANQFYSLLNYKREKFNSIVLECRYPINQIGEKKANGLVVMQILTTDFVTRLDEDPNFYENLNQLEIRTQFFEIGRQLFNDPISPVISYFFIYKNLISLIRDSEISDKDKSFYLDVLCNSMFQEEQMVLFWIGPAFPDLNRSIENSYIFNQIWYDKNLKNYGLKFHKINNFRINSWIEAFQDSQKENPA